MLSGQTHTWYSTMSTAGTLSKVLLVAMYVACDQADLEKLASEMLFNNPLSFRDDINTMHAKWTLACTVCCTVHSWENYTSARNSALKLRNNSFVYLTITSDDGCLVAMT